MLCFTDLIIMKFNRRTLEYTVFFLLLTNGRYILYKFGEFSHASKKDCRGFRRRFKKEKKLNQSANFVMR